MTEFFPEARKFFVSAHRVRAVKESGRAWRWCCSSITVLVGPALKSRDTTAGGEENERNPQRPRSAQQRLRLKGKSERRRRKDAVLLLSHNLSAGALGTGDAAGPASICSWGATCQGSAKPNQHRLVLCAPTWPLLPPLASESRAD